MKNFKAGTVTRPTEKLNMRIAVSGQKGYTIVEIVMVIVILGVIGAFTFQFVAHGVQAFKKSSARKDLYDQGRLALERMVRELRDGKEVTASASSSITFKKAHPAQAADNIEEVKFELVGTELKRVGDPSDTAQTAVLASNVTSFQVGAGGSGGGGTTLFSDDFSDGVITDWSNASGGYDMAEAGGVFTTTGNNTSHYTVDVGSTWTDYSFNVDAMAIDNDVVGITFRVEDADSFYVLDQRFGDGSWNLRLRLNDNGTWSTLGTIANNGANPGQVDSETTWYNYKVEVSGTNIKAYIDDVLKFDVDDTTISAGTVGLWLSSSGGTDFDNALVESSGGNLATLEITLSSAEGGTVSMRTMVYLRNLP